MNFSKLNPTALAYSSNVPKFGRCTAFECIPYLATEYDAFDTCTVLLSHLPPAKTKTAMDRKTKKDLGNRNLSRMLYNNLLCQILCRHAICCPDMFRYSVRISPILQLQLYI